MLLPEVFVNAGSARLWGEGEKACVSMIDHGVSMIDHGALCVVRMMEK